MADNIPKGPSKGILKNSSSFDKQDVRVSNSTTSATQRKSLKETKWDEMNILATLHPPDKDYGHMKIDEPKTPYNHSFDAVDASDLAERIRLGAESLPKALQTTPDEDDEDSDDSDDDLTPEEKAKRKEFANKRKDHYNEFYAVQLARKLLEEEDEDDEDEKDVQEHSQSNIQDSSCFQSCSK